MSNDTFDPYVAVKMPKPPKPKPMPKPKLETKAQSKFVYEPEDVSKIYAAAIKHYNLEAPNSEKALVKSKEHNLDIVYPSPYQLQIDIDDEHSYAVYQAIRPIVDKYYGITAIKDNPSRGGGKKRHITLTLGQRVTRMERIALQACMGSDRVRELLGVIQERDHDPHPTLFFEKRDDESGQTVSG